MEAYAPSYEQGVSIGARAYEKRQDDDENKIQRAIMNEMRMAQIRNMQTDNARQDMEFKFKQQEADFRDQSIKRQRDAQSKYWEGDTSPQTEYEAFGNMPPNRRPLDDREQKIATLKDLIKNSDDDLKVLKEVQTAHQQRVDKGIPKSKDELEQWEKQLADTNKAIVNRSLQLARYRTALDEHLGGKIPSVNLHLPGQGNEPAYTPGPRPTTMPIGAPAGPSPTGSLSPREAQFLNLQNSWRYATPAAPPPQAGVGANGPAMVQPSGGPMPSTQVPNTMILSQPERFPITGTLPDGRRVAKDAYTGKWVYIDPAR
jgi:hypothetical protein